MHNLGNFDSFDDSIHWQTPTNSTHSYSSSNNSDTITVVPALAVRAPATAPTAEPSAPNTVAPPTIKQKWVINLSNTPSLQHKELLPRGPNFTITPSTPGRLMWQQLRRPVSDSLPWRQMSLDHIPAAYLGITAPNKSNITKEEHWAIKELRENQTSVVLTANMGWPWWLWTNRTTQTRPLHYFQTPAPTTTSARTPLPDSGTDSSPH